jgi:hypothetical protein
MHRRVFGAILTLFALSVTLVAPVRAQTDERCFPETNYCISGRIREFWEQNGGLSVFGFPIGPQQEETVEGNSFQAQWFERNRLELHPENAAPYDVLLGRLGVDRLQQQGRDWFTFPKSEAQANCQFFPQTGHNICGDILASWQANGLEFDGQSGKGQAENLALFGLPLSDAQTETIEGKDYTTQWFERARFELHPENAPPYNVLLGLLGNEIRAPKPEPAPALYEGNWDGKSTHGASISFTVSDNAINYLEIDIVCGSDSITYTDAYLKIPLSGNGFSIQNSNYTVTGTLDASGAAGNMQITRQDIDCGRNFNDSWNAMRTGLAPFDGAWRGTTSQGAAISFIIRRNAIVDPNVGIQGCVVGGLGAKGVFPITGNTFSLRALNGMLAITGMFNSNTSVSGDTQIQFSECNINATWTATKK